MRKNYLLATITALLLATGTFAQTSRSITGVKSILLRNSGTIFANNEVKGYYSFYQSDKIDKKTNEYTISIADENGNSIKDIKFQDDKDISVIESAYNGESIMFLFYNKKERTLEYRAYGFDGKVKSTYTKELTKRSQALLENAASMGDDGDNQTLFDVGSEAYVTVYPVKEKKYYTYEVNMFFTDKKKQWTYEAAEEQEDRWAAAQYLGKTDSLVIFEVIRQKTLLGGNPHSWLIGLNLYSGKKAFEISTEKEDFKFYPMNVIALQNSSNFLLIGSYYDSDAKIMKDKNLGIATWSVDPKGKILTQKYNGWDGEISKFLDTDKRGRVKDVGFIYFHKVLQTADGKIYAVGEGYNKVVSAAGTVGALGAAMLGGRSNMAMFKIKVSDMLLMEFDPNFKIAKATIFDKNSNSVEMPAGAGYLSPHTMALLVKAYGGFDYSYTKTNADKTDFVIGYSDYVRSSDYKGMTFNSISIRNGKMTTDQIKLKSKANFMRVFPGKTGTIFIMEYYKKEKRLEYRQEKLN